MTISLLLGTDLAIHEAARRLAELTRREIGAWHNDHWGRYYATLGPERPQLQLIANERDDEGYLQEADFPDPAVLVYVINPAPEIEVAVRQADWLELLRAREL